MTQEMTNEEKCFHPNSWDCGVSTIDPVHTAKLCQFSSVSIPTRGIVVFLPRR